MSEKQDQKLEKEIDKIKDCKREKNKTIYVSDIDADIDTGLVNLIDYFNNTVEHPTTYCCSKLLRDHYDLEKLEQLSLSEMSRLTYPHLTQPPYFILKGIYHTVHENKTVVDESFHEFKDNFPDAIGLQITTNGFKDLLYHQSFQFRLEPEIIDLSSVQETRRYVYKCYFGSKSSLSVLFDELETNIELYDKMLTGIFEAFQLIHQYPNNLLRFLYLQVDKTTEELRWELRKLPEIPDELESDDVIGITSEEHGELTEWKVVATLDQLKDHICGDDKYVWKMRPDSGYKFGPDDPK